MHQAKLVDALDDLLLSVAPVNTIRGQDEKVILGGDGSRVTLWLRDDELLHLIISECSAHAELTIDAIMEDAALGSLNAHPLVLSTGRVLAVQLLPAAVLARKGRYRVSNVGKRKTAVQNEA